MTRVEICKNSNGEIIGIKVQGHAEYSKDGHDIVCSAISALSFNLAYGLFDVIGFSDKEVGYLEKDAYIGIVYKLNYDDIDIDKILKAKILFKAFAISLKNMQEQYPDNVKVENIIYYNTEVNL